MKLIKKNFDEFDVKISYEIDKEGRIMATGTYKNKTIKAWTHVEQPVSPIWTYELELDALWDSIMKNFYEMEDDDEV